MKRRNSRTKAGGRRRLRPNRGNFLWGKYIYVTDHAIARYQQRIKGSNTQNAQDSIVANVKRSRLIALTKYGGREIRENRGVLYVCELQGNCLNVITVLIGDVDLRFVI